MTKHLLTTALAASLAFSAKVAADPAEGLNVIVTSPERQAQMMAMVLSVQTVSAHDRTVNLTLCGAAGELALKATQTEALLPSNKSPTMLLQTLIDSGANVQVCPLYLPNAGKSPEDLLPGIGIAKPAAMAGKLLDREYQNLTF